MIHIREIPEHPVIAEMERYGEMGCRRKRLPPVGRYVGR